MTFIGKYYHNNEIMALEVFDHHTSTNDGYLIQHGKEMI